MIKRIAILFDCIGLVIISFLFDMSNGLLNDSGFYVTEYQSGISNDNVMIAWGRLIFLFPLIISIIRIRKRFSIIDIFIHYFILLIQLLLLLLIEQGSIIATILNGNYLLLIWLILFLVYSILPILFKFIYKSSDLK